MLEYAFFYGDYSALPTSDELVEMYGDEEI